jgi:hypothetical protein
LSVEGNALERKVNIVEIGHVTPLPIAERLEWKADPVPLRAWLAKRFAVQKRCKTRRIAANLRGR